MNYDSNIITQVHLVERSSDLDNPLSSENPAVFETEPKEIADLDLYHEASDNVGIIKIGMAITGTNIIGTPTVTNATGGRINFFFKSSFNRR